MDCRWHRRGHEHLQRGRLALAVGLLLLGGAAAQEPVLPAGYSQLAETPDAQWDLRLSRTGPIDLVFAADATRGYRLQLGDEGVLSRFDGAATTRIASAAPPAGELPQTIIIRRRASNLSVLVDGRLWLDVLDGTHATGLAGLAGGGAALDGETAYQAVEDIYFADDFMRTEAQQQLGVWSHVHGNWRFYSVSETNPRADVRLSVNPFSLGLHSADAQPAVVTAGYPFWGDYEASVSLRSRGARAGLIVAYRDEGNYYLLRGDLREQALRPRRIELVRLRDGVEQVLAGGSALLSAEQWYRLAVRLRGGRLQCFLDEGLLFDWLDPDAAGGPIGLWSDGGAETLFDDVRCETNLSWPFDRAATLKRNGAGVGDWKMPGSPEEPVVGPPSTRKLQAPAAGLARYVFGDPAGGPARLDGAVDVPRHGTLALLFGYRDERNHLRGEWDTKAGRLRLVRVADGVTTPLGSVRDALTPGRPHTVALDLLTGGRVQIRRDGLLRLRATLEEQPPGRLGVATGDLPATFSDLLVRQFVATDTEVEVDNSNFADDPYMLNWASSLADWLPVGEPAKDAEGQQVYWHKGDFYRAYHLRIPVVAGGFALLLNNAGETWLPAGDAAVANALRLTAEEGKTAPGDGYALHLIAAGTPQARLILFRAGGRVTDAALPEGADTVTVARDGGVTWVEAGGRDVLIHHDPEPLDGSRVALRIKDQDTLLKVSCRREGVIDEIFERAPCDWIQQGEWEITNRFSCTPTWSHMAALERAGLGALWHKDGFPGNVTLEYYAGMRMQVPTGSTGWVGYYPRPGDFSGTIGARPFDLASGVSLLPGAWDPGWTSTLSRLVRGTTVLAETDRPLVPRTREDQGQRYIPVPYIRAGRDVHGAWYYVKSRLVDGRLHGIFDSVPILDADAPTGLGDRVAVWTQDNEIMIARVRITYQEKRIPPRLVDAPAVEPEPVQPEPTQLIIAEAPGLAYDFDRSTDGWGPRDALRQVHVTRRERGGNGFLRVENLLPGGSFEAVAYLRQTPPQPQSPASSAAPRTQQGEPLDISRAAVLRFDYALSPPTRINLYLRLNDRTYSIPLTGETTDSPVLPVLARPDGIVADGTWRTCRVPLGAALRRTFGQTAVVLSDLRFGHRHEGYLTAGFGGNPVGAWYALDNIALIPEVAPGAPVTPVPRPPAGAFGQVAVDAVLAAVSKSPTAEPVPLGGPLTLPTEPGFWWLSVQARAGEQLTPIVRQPILIAEPEPPLRAVSADADWDGGPIRVAFGDSAPLDCTLTVGGQTLSWAQCVTVDAEARQLSLDPRWSGAVHADGATVPLVLKASFAGGAVRELTIERTYRRAADRRPPTVPRISGMGLSYDGENGDVGWQPIQGGTVVQRADDGDGRGVRARIVNTMLGGACQVSLPAPDLSLGSYPLLMMDYRVAAPVRFDLAVHQPGTVLGIPVFDRSGSYPLLAGVADAQRDGAWHRLTVDLQAALSRRVEFGPAMYGATSLSAFDGDYSGMAPGASYELDDTRLVRVVRGDGQAKVGWSAYDAGGIAGWRIGWGADESVEPNQELPPETTEMAVNAASEGLNWLAVQARDAAGNLSAVVRQPVIVDNSPPSFGTPTPAPGPLGRSELVIPMAGLGPAGIDPLSLKLTTGDRTSPAGRGLVRLNAEANTLTWDWAWGHAAFGGPVADGTPVPMRLSGADLAGQPAPEVAWDYQVSYAADDQPPLAPRVAVADQPLALLETFDQGTGSLGAWASSYTSPVSVAYDAEAADRCLQISANGTGRYLHTGAVDLTKHPYLSFDYKVGEGVVLHLQLYLNGTYYSINLNGSSASYPKIGEVPFTPDGKWHTLVVDLLAVAKAQLPTADAWSMRYLSLLERGSSGGRPYFLDNVAIFGPQPRELTVTWEGYDATGIAASAIGLGGDLAAGPPTQPVDGRSTKLVSGGAGPHLLQLRLRDGAGHWGGSARRVVVTP